MTPSETSTQAAPAPLQVRVTDEMEEAACKAWWPLHWPHQFSHRDVASIRDNMRKALTAALDLSTPPQIATLEAENVKLRAERDEALGKIEEAQNRASETAKSWKHRCFRVMGALGLDYGDPDWLMPDELKRAERAEAEVARLTEALKGAGDAPELVPAERLEQIIGTQTASHAETHDMAVELIIRRRDTLAALKESTDAQD